MSFTYSPTLATSLDRVRFLIGDVVDVGHLVENEEITFILSVQPIETFAAAAIAESLAGRFAARPNITIGQTSVSGADLMAHYKLLAHNLRQAGGSIGGGDGTGVATLDPMFVGGISRVEREQLADDTDAIQPSFRLGRDDHPGTFTESEDLEGGP